MRLEVAREGHQQRGAEIDHVGPALEAERTREVQLPVADVGHEHEPQAADECDEGPGVDLRRVAQRGRGDAEQEHEVADWIAERESCAHRVRVQGRENGSEERVPDDDAAADDHDQGVDREPQRVAPGRGCPLEHEEGDDDDRVIGDVRDVGHRRGGRAAAAEVQPRPCQVAHGVDQHRGGQHEPAQANSADVDAPRGAKDDRDCQQVQGGLAHVGDRAPGGRVPQTGGEQGDRDGPAAGDEGDKDPIEREPAVSPPGSIGTGGARWQRPPWRTGGSARAKDGDGDHVRFRDLVAWSAAGDREDRSTVFVRRRPEQVPEVRWCPSFRRDTTACDRRGPTPVPGGGPRRARPR